MLTTERLGKRYLDVQCTIQFFSSSEIVQNKKMAKTNKKTPEAGKSIHRQDLIL